MGKQAATYPSQEQHDQWTANAEEMGVPLSQWMEMMIEAGRKNFSRAATEAELDQLRQERERLSDELQEAQERINALEAAINE